MPDFNGRESYTSAPGPRYVNNKRGANKSHSKTKTTTQPKKKGDSILNMPSNGYTLSNNLDNNNSHTNDNLTVDSRKFATNFDKNKSP